MVQQNCKGVSRWEDERGTERKEQRADVAKYI